MDSFGFYSQYYDLLYKDKDYEAEVQYVLDLLNRYTSYGPTSQILELGSGTGVHAALLAKRGLNVHGVELSQTMLNVARERSLPKAGELSFARGDARDYRTENKFDAVISLFHVLSYQTRQEDLRRVFTTASEHLEIGGLLVFDFWYGPAVLWQRPMLRVKRLEDERLSLVRIADPFLRDGDNVVDVNYTIFAEDKLNGTITKLIETHRMRYLFISELDNELSSAGFDRLTAEEWLTGAQPSKETWGVCVVARKCRSSSNCG